MKRWMALLCACVLLVLTATAALAEEEAVREDDTYVVIPNKLDKLIELSSFRRGALLQEADTDYFKTGITSPVTVVAYYHQPATKGKVTSTRLKHLGKYVQRTNKEGKPLYTVIVPIRDADGNIQTDENGETMWKNILTTEQNNKPLTEGVTDANGNQLYGVLDTSVTTHDSKGNTVAGLALVKDPATNQNVVTTDAVNMPAMTSGFGGKVTTDEQGRTLYTIRDLNGETVTDKNGDAVLTASQNNIPVMMNQTDENGNVLYQITSATGGIVVADSAGTKETTTYATNAPAMKYTGKLGGNWYYYVEESYPTGNIALCRATYNLMNKLVSYIIIYRISTTEEYTIQYSPEDKPQKGWYWCITDQGEERIAYANSMKTWRDEKTGLLTNSSSLQWDLHPLGGGFFDNPPRKKR